MTDTPPCAPAAARNAAAILGVLQHEFAGVTSVLEIGSGTGQHAVCFAAALPGLTWQTSDLENRLEGIRQRLQVAGIANVRRPLALDMLAAKPADVAGHDAVFTANTLHIMPPEGTARMLRFVAGVLPEGGVFCCYGPFRRAGAFTTPSNEAFDCSLRAGDARMGLRDLEHVSAAAESAGLALVRTYAMPANNLLLVWRRTPVPGAAQAC